MDPRELGLAYPILLDSWAARPECLEAAGPARVELIGDGLALDHQSRGDDVREAPGGAFTFGICLPKRT